MQLDHGVTLDFAEPPPGAEIAPQHYAFLDPSGHYLEIITRPYGSGR